MKRVTLLALALVGTSAWACPNLAGNYICNVDGQMQSLMVRQDQANGVTTYYLNHDAVVANGLTEKLPDNGDLKNQTFKAWCDKETLMGALYAEVHAEGEAVAQIDVEMSMSLDEKQNLIQTSKGTFKDLMGNQSEPLEESNLVCNRQ